MFQVLTRRLARGIEQKDLPDLLVVDGGKGQLNVARAALKEVGLTVADVPLAGLAKSRVLEDEQRFAARQGFSLAAAWAEKAGPEPEVPQIDDAEAALGRLSPVANASEAIPAGDSAQPAADKPAAPAAQLSGRSRKKGRFVKGDIERSPERVFLPGQKNPIVLRQNTSEMFLLQRLRDEAHRFAITFHRKLRRERNFRSVLEEIPGIGDKRKRQLLSHFGSLKRIRAATAEEMAALPGFNAQLAERVQGFLSAEGAAKAAEVEAREAAAGAAEGDELPEAIREETIEASASGNALERDDVAFDAGQAELAALEDSELPGLEDSEPPELADDAEAHGEL
jgi:excinuclease ABC subunit C